MLHLHHSNRLEGLMDELAGLLLDPVGSVLEPETVVVQNTGMERWLMQQLAQRQGIAANIEFPLPATFVWRVFESQLGHLPRDSVFDKDSLLWRIMALLPELLPQPGFLPIRHYLAGDATGLKAYQLCSRVADLFDQYLVYRSEMILGWEQQGRAGGQADLFAPETEFADNWQAQLWRTLVRDTDGKHRARLWRRFFDLAEMDAHALPARVMIFGLSGMAPNYVQVLARLAEVVDVHIFLLNPCKEYWVDIVDSRGQARRRAAWRRQGKEDVSGLLDVGNPLLAAMGHVGQVFVDQLLDLDIQEQASFASPLQGEGSLLQAIQWDVLELADSRRRGVAERAWIASTDNSIHLHVCHSAMREVQVLHDRLLHLIDNVNGLEPREIVVMAPNIEAYAPYIEAVFGTPFADRDNPQSIPWSIADLSIAAESPLLESLQVLLKLPDSRFEVSELLGLLDVPALARRFAIDVAVLPQIRQWVAETGVRWGLDADMREQMGLPGEIANSWEAGLRSLFLGYAMTPGNDLYQGVLPYADIEGNEAEDLGRLQALVSALAQWRKRLSGVNTLSGWKDQLRALLDAFYAPDPQEEGLLQAVRDGLSNVTSCAERAEFDGEISLPVIRHHLTGVLADNSQTRRFLAGGVTFCNMVPMRSIPFRVVCLLGMNDTDFPRNQRPLGFDLMAARPRHTDRSRRLDDRYLFLEALLSARDVFYLSYVGHDIRDNSVKVPSVVVSELMDYVGLSFQADHLRVDHPLQPFSKDYYRTDQRPDLFSYDPYWLAAADARVEDQAALFADTALPADKADEIALADLIRFLLNPSEWFLRRGLGIDYGWDEEGIDDLEPFEINGLVNYSLRQDALQAVLTNEPLNELKLITRARGLLPHGALGELGFQAVVAEVEQLGARIQPRLKQPVDALELDLSIDDRKLYGWVGNMTANGRVVYRATKLKAKDQLALWLNHLALNSVFPEGHGGLQSIHVAEDQTLRLGPIAQQEAEQHLREVIRAWDAGQIRPLKFYPATSLAYVTARNNDAGEAATVKAMSAAWDGAYGDGGNAYIGTAQRGSDPWDAEFQQWSDTLLGAMVKSAEWIKANKDQVSD